MNEQTHNDLQPLPEQLIYANMLFTGVWVGIVILLITYFLYVSGIMTAHVDIATIPLHWGKGRSRIHGTDQFAPGMGMGLPPASGRFPELFRPGAFGIDDRFLLHGAGVGYFKRKNWILFWICVAEILVLSVAASAYWVQAAIRVQV